MSLNDQDDVLVNRKRGRMHGMKAEEAQEEEGRESTRRERGR